MPGETSGAGDEPGQHSPASVVEESFCFRSSGGDDQFAIIHDEPFITIVFENGLFWGEIVDCTEERLERAVLIADNYHLQIVGYRRNGADYHLRLTEVHESVN